MKSGEAYGISKSELFNYLKQNNFEVKLFLNRIYDQNDMDNHLVHWDVLDVIAIKRATLVRKSESTPLRLSILSSKS